MKCGECGQECDDMTCETCISEEVRKACRLDKAGRSCVVVMTLRDGSVGVVVDASEADPEEVKAAFEAAGERVSVILDERGLDFAGVDFVSFAHGDRCQVRDANGNQIHYAIWAERGGLCCILDVSTGRRRSRLQRFPCPLTFEPLPKTEPPA